MRASWGLPARSSLGSLAALWQQVASTPLVRSAVIVNRGVHVTTETHDVQSNKKILREYHVTGGTLDSHPSVIDASFVRVVSPSGTKCLTFQVVDDKRCEVNIICGGSVQRFSTPFLPVKDATFQHFSWSSDESVVVFAAQKKLPEAKHPWDQAEEGRSFWETKDSWGELHASSSGFTVVSLIVDEGVVRDLICEEFQKSWTAVEPLVIGSKVMFTAISHHPRKLGLVYCRNRPGVCFTVGMTGGQDPQSVPSLNRFRTVANARLRDGNVVFLAPSEQGLAGNFPHNCAFSLHCVAAVDILSSAGDASVRTLVSIPEGGSQGFHGLFPSLGNEIWFLSPTTLLVGSIHRSSYVVYAVEISKDSQIPVPFKSVPNGSVSVLDVRDGVVALCVSSMATGNSVMVYRDGTFETVATFAPTTASSFSVATELVGCPALHDSEVLLHYVDATEGKPVILQLHGGPHSTDTGSFAYMTFFWLACGFNVASVNYGGSTGFGQERIVELMGHIGSNDVADCIGCLDALKGRIDLTAVVVAGGSHGGFLAAHLTGQFPQAFKAALIRNPVINVASIYYESDIPDWALACTGVREDAVDMNKMMAMSPIVHASKVVTPTFLGIGCDDLRVPPPQGKSWFHHVRGNAHKPPVRMMEYTGNSHPLDGVHAAADFAIRGTYFAHQALSAML